MLKSNGVDLSTFEQNELSEGQQEDGYYEAENSNYLKTSQRIVNNSEIEGSSFRRNISDFSNSGKPGKKTQPWVPILRNPGYTTNPSIQELSRMTRNELERIKHFRIENKFGIIEFDDYTDVTYLDLDKLVIITEETVGNYI